MVYYYSYLGTCFNNIILFPSIDPHLVLLLWVQAASLLLVWVTF